MYVEEFTGKPLVLRSRPLCKPPDTTDESKRPKVAEILAIQACLRNPIPYGMPNIWRLGLL